MIAVKFAEKKMTLVEAQSALLTYEREGITFRIICKCKDSEKDNKFLTWAFDLVEENVKHFYVSCIWGWNPQSKRAEINAKWARYIVMYDNNEPIALAMFRFDMENNYPVIYCYELHVIKTYQGLGIGTHLMQLLEHIAIKHDMQKVMLTVFKENLEAQKFYTKLGYVADEISPNEEDDEPYYILSKSLNKLK